MIGTDKHQLRETVEFGPFRLSPAERLLEKHGMPVAVGSRALDILIALVERCGQVVSPRDLIARAWPGMVIDSANLRVNVGLLRKALGDGEDGARYIANVPGRGYCFVAVVIDDGTSQALSSSRSPETALQSQSLKLPAPLARMVGRETTVTALAASIAAKRFVSVVGAGGIGKTTVAVSVAHALLSEFDDAVFFVDLGALTDATLVTSAVASALGLFTQSSDPLPGLLAFLAGRRILLIVDNCEHVIDASAALAERLFSDLPDVHLLTTSRESLRVEGENIHWLRPLEIPRDTAELSSAQALASPAVQVFMDRAAASGHQGALSDADAPIVADLCRRLDGLPLAIELAASRVGVYGIQGTADLLNNCSGLDWQGRRSALPRHQTLHAMLEWSYSLLSERDARVLRRLAVFVGIFALEAAQAVAADADVAPPAVAEALTSLLEKSLIWTTTLERATYYRLPDTTRAYAFAKLAELEGRDPCAMRHARYYASKFDERIVNAARLGVSEWAPWARHVSNVRAALEWSFSANGSKAIGVTLAARAAPLFLGLSLLGECQRWSGQGLQSLEASDRGTMVELSLQEAHAISVMFTSGNGKVVRSAIERGLQLAQELNEKQHHLDLLSGLHIFLVRIGSFPEAVTVARRSVEIAGELGAPMAMVMAEWMLGCAYHLTGNQILAQRYCEQGFKRAEEAGQLHLHVFGYDHRLRALIVLTRTLWLRGFPDRAAQTGRQAIDEAERSDHPVNLCITLIYTITVFLWRGDVSEAKERADQLIVHAGKHSLWPYHAVGLALKGESMIVSEWPCDGIELLRRALAVLDAEQHNILTPGFYRALAQGLAHCGKADEAVAAMDVATERAARTGDTFETADLLRAHGEMLLATGDRLVDSVEEFFHRSLQVARSQGAPGMELRAAIVLAKLWKDRSRGNDARELLGPVYEAFSEGHQTADLKAARKLLEQLAQAEKTGPAP